MQGEDKPKRKYATLYLDEGNFYAPPPSPPKQVDKECSTCEGRGVDNFGEPYCSVCSNTGRVPA